MPAQPRRPMLEVEPVGDVTIVRFTQRSILQNDMIEAIAEQLQEVVANTDCRKFVLNFGNVETMTSGMIGNLIAVLKKVETAGGRLVVCKVGSFLMEIFKILDLPKMVAIYNDEQEALQKV